MNKIDDIDFRGARLNPAPAAPPHPAPSAMARDTVGSGEHASAVALGVTIERARVAALLRAKVNVLSGQPPSEEVAGAIAVLGQFAADLEGK